MEGFLDELNCAFLTIDIGQGPLDFQVDTGFGGTLVVGEELLDTTHLKPAGGAIAELAAGQSYEFEAFWAVFNWLGEPAKVRILIGPGKECLIGTIMFAPHRLEIDYGARTVRLIMAKE